LEKENKHILSDLYTKDELELYKFCQNYSSLERDHGVHTPSDYIWFDQQPITDIITD
jgi:hypothetical protein